MQRLAELGHELHRPEADLLRNGIDELRIGLRHANCGILYFFHGRAAAVLADAVTQEDRVPDYAIETALTRRREDESDPGLHTFQATQSAGKEAMRMRKTRKRARTSNVIEIIHHRDYEDRPRRIAELDEAQANDSVARQIYQLRKRAGLTQGELARSVGTTTSVISRLEDAAYARHSLAMLRRIARALNKRVEVSFVDLGQKTEVAR